MNGATVVAAVFLLVSVTALTMQSAALYQLRRGAPAGVGAGLAYRGLVRTSVLRVGVALLYTALGVASLVSPPSTGVVALAAFTFTQIIWVLSGLADVRLKRRLQSGVAPGRHRGGTRRRVWRL